jgi:hypothetical protein
MKAIGFFYALAPPSGKPLVYRRFNYVAILDADSVALPQAFVKQTV